MLTQLASLCLLAGVTVGQQQAYGQCGGIGWTGASTCVTGYACEYEKSDFLLKSPVFERFRNANKAITISHSNIITNDNNSKFNRYYWIRAVETPYSHSYLQAAPTATPSPGSGDAYLRPPGPGNAGQFNVIDGQLVYYNPNNSSNLYMWVEDSTNKTQRTLETWFDSTPADYGTFAFSGDTLTWSVDDINRPNTGAWYVCGDAGQLYINTGAYDYDTPSGCYDETIHSYGGSTADV
ncbi:hypothetical protein F5Y16DRAFT_402236 [Xylariaceae sp. FL0255]|nr:hypothetical protein F5Y16DRAFT_402236 [Xylariaceae sp. FL0255]